MVGAKEMTGVGRANVVGGDRLPSGEALWAGIGIKGPVAC